GKGTTDGHFRAQLLGGKGTTYGHFRAQLLGGRRLLRRLMSCSALVPKAGQGLGSTRRRPRSRSWAASIGVGAFVKRSTPDCVLGNAITSRMFSSPARTATNRSMPTAKPACGGAPKRNASSKKPKRRLA